MRKQKEKSPLTKKRATTTKSSVDNKSNYYDKNNSSYNYMFWEFSNIDMFITINTIELTRTLYHNNKVVLTESLENVMGEPNNNVFERATTIIKDNIKSCETTILESNISDFEKRAIEHTKMLLQQDLVSYMNYEKMLESDYNKINK